MKKNRAWLWLIPLSLLWPLVHALVFLVRSGKLLPDPTELLVFFPMSVIAGALFLALWLRASKFSQKTGLILGYLLASPIAYLGSLLSGLLDQVLLRATLWGAGSLIAGILVGASIGWFIARFSTK